MNRKPKLIMSGSSKVRYHHFRVRSALLGQRPYDMPLIATTAAPCAFASASTALPYPMRVILNEVDGKHHGVEFELLEGMQGSPRRVRGKTDVFDLALLLRLENRLHGAALGESLRHFFRLDQAMELVQIEVIGFQSLQRSIQFLTGAFLVSHLRLAGQEVLITRQALQPNPIRFSQSPLAYAGATSK